MVKSKVSLTRKIVTNTRKIREFLERKKVRTLTVLLRKPQILGYLLLPAPHRKDLAPEAGVPLPPEEDLGPLTGVPLPSLSLPQKDLVPEALLPPPPEEDLEPEALLPPPKRRGPGTRGLGTPSPPPSTPLCQKGPGTRGWDQRLGYPLLSWKGPGPRGWRRDVGPETGIPAVDRQKDRHL